MVNKIRTTHVGSLPRTPELLEANLQRGELPDAELSLIHISEPTRHFKRSRMPSSA